MSTISVDYDVLNQRGSPAWFTDTFANIPTAGYVGRMFISKDTFAFYRDTGTGWDLIGGPGIGTLTGSGVVGQVSFFNGTQVLAGNNNLFWDNTNSRLGINTTTPGQPLDIHSTGNTLVQLNNTTTANSNISFQNQNVAKWRVGNVYNGGANSFDIQNAGLSTNALSISSTTNLITINSIIATGTISSQGLIATTGGLDFQKNAIPPTFYAGDVILYAESGTNNIVFRDTLSSAKLLFNNSTQTYTFPASTGTIALTSDLSSYLPLTGGTLTGQLYINPTNAAIVGLDVASNTTRFRSDNVEGFKRQLEIVMGSGTLVQLTAKGYLANYGTDMAFYTATTGGTNASPGIYITGTNNRVGIKTGTPAYDLDVSGTMGTSSTAIFGGNVTIGLPTADPILILNGDNSGGNSYVNFNADNGGTKAQIQGTKFAGTGGQLIFKTLQSSVMTTSMTIQQTGDIGIGVSPTSGQRLSVRGQDATSTNYGLVVSNTTPQSTFIVRNDGAIFLTGPYPFTTASGTNMWIDTSGVIQRNVSSIRYKKDVKNYEKGLNELMKLRPVSYLSKSEIDIPKRYAGMIAEELFELGFNEYVNLNEKGEPDSISYSSMIALLTKAIQELNEKLIKNNIN